MTIVWPWPKVTAVALINKNLLVCRIRREPLNQSLQNSVAISVGEFLLETYDDLYANFFKVNYVTSTLDLTHDFDVWFWRSNFKIAVFQELLSDQRETKGNQIT